MPGRDTKYQKLAREADERLRADRAMQQQLSLLPDEQDDAALVDDGRAKRGQGKALSQMREFLAAKGYRFPEEVLAQIAGLDRADGDSLEAAMAQAERILAWAQTGARPVKDGDGYVEDTPTLAQRLNTLQMVRTAQLRAADALMPYGAPKATPDDAPPPANQIVVPGAPTADPAAQARDVTPGPARISGRMAPADVVHEMQQKQQVSDAQSDASDEESRTE